MRRAPLVLLLRTRRAGWAVLLGAVLAVTLLTSERDVAVPLFGTTTTTVFIWPLLATAPTALVLAPTMVEWEQGSSRPIRLLHTLVVLGVGGTSALVLVLLRPAGWTSALALHLALQAASITGTRLLGDWAWMPTVAVGSLSVVNSPFVTHTVVDFTDRHWPVIGVVSSLAALAALALPRTNDRFRARLAFARRGSRAP